MITAEKIAPLTTFVFSFIYSNAWIIFHKCSLYRGFSLLGTEKTVHCSERRGVHYIERYLQQKSVGGTEISVQSGGVHFIEVFTKRGFTVFNKVSLISSLVRGFLYIV